MSALGHKRTNLGEPKSYFVRFGPIADKILRVALLKFQPQSVLSMVLRRRFEVHRHARGTRTANFRCACLLVRHRGRRAYRPPLQWDGERPQ